MNPIVLLLLAGGGYLWYRHRHNVASTQSPTAANAPLVNPDGSFTPAGNQLLQQMGVNPTTAQPSAGAIGGANVPGINPTLTGSGQ